MRRYYLRVILPVEQSKMFKNIFFKKILSNEVIPGSGYELFILKRFVVNKLELETRLNNKGFKGFFISNTKFTNKKDLRYDLFYQCRRNVIKNNLNCNI